MSLGKKKKNENMALLRFFWAILSQNFEINAKVWKKKVKNLS